MNEHLYRGETHVFDADGRILLFDVLGGGFFEIDRVTRDALEVCGERSPEDVVQDTWK